jgi:TetR/AcrR family transcriptional regulator, transcriptional repressor for nem operon
MRVSKEKAHENRERVIDVAGELLRQKGVDGIGIADLMDAAGLTHGGFYRQFKSKDDLVAQAIARAFDDTRIALQDHVARTPGDPLRALVDYYVSSAHVDAVGQGCSLPALGSDAGRTSDPALSAVFGSAVEAYLDAIASLVQGKDPSTARQRALAILAEMVGAIVIGRAVGAGPLRDEVVRTVRDDLVDRN